MPEVVSGAGPDDPNEQPEANLDPTPGSESLKLGVLTRQYREEQSSQTDEQPQSPSPVLQTIATRAMPRMTLLASFVVRRGGMRDHDAEEVVQEAWLSRIQKLLGRGNLPIRNSEHFFRLAKTCMLFTLLDLRKKRSTAQALRESPTPDGSDQPAPTPSPVLEDTRLDVQAALGELEPKVRETIVMRVSDGHSRRGTAAKLDMTQAEVRSRVKKGKEALAEALSDYGEDHASEGNLKNFPESRPDPRPNPARKSS